MNTTKSERKRIRNRKKRDSGRIGGVRPMRRLSALTLRTRSVTNEDSNEQISRNADVLCTTSRGLEDDAPPIEAGMLEHDMEDRNQHDQQPQTQLEQQIIEQHIAEQSMAEEQHMVGQFQCITSSELSDYDRTPLINDGSNEVNEQNIQFIIGFN